MSKVLITGASGMLGRYVCSKVRLAGHDVIAPTRTDMDLMKPSGVYAYIRQVMPNVILHLAAETDVDLCERDPRCGGVANQMATRFVAQAARDTKAWMLFISTSNVFGGGQSKPTYNELDIPCPLNYYGRSKLFGEKEIEAIYPDNSLIMRAGWMIGGGRDHDHKFVGKLVGQITKNVPIIRAVSDKYGTITSAPVLADFIVNALTERRLGLLHFASRGVASRYDIAVELANISSFKGKIEPVLSSEFPLSAPRPTFEGIQSIYADVEGKWAPKFWREDIRDYLIEFGF